MIQITRLTKKVDFKTQMKVSLPTTILSGFLGVFLAYKGYGVWSLVCMAIFKSILNMFLFFYRTKWLPSLVFHVEKFNHHFSFGYKLTFSGLLDIIFSNVYQVIIGKYYQPAILGFYDRASKLKDLPVQLLTLMVSRVTYPIFAEFKHDNERLKSAYKKIIQILVFIIAPLLLISSALAEPLFRFLFSHKWLEAVPYFQILCWNGILYPVYAFNLSILQIKGRTDLFLKLEVIKKILLSTVLVFSVQFGIYGMLYGGICFSLLAFYVNTYYTGKFINYKPYEQITDIVPIVLLAFISALTVYFFDIFLESYFSKDLFRLLLGSFIGTAIFLILSYTLKIKSFFVLTQILKNNDKSN